MKQLATWFKWLFAVADTSVLLRMGMFLNGKCFLYSESVTTLRILSEISSTTIQRRDLLCFE
jgi:hypothetical protein